jgi:hypothetical protein
MTRSGVCRFAPVLTLVVLAGCPKNQTAGGTGSGGDRNTLPEDLAALTIPARPDTRSALENLDRLADGGNQAAAWGRLHYLIDVFDDARFRPGGDSGATLAAAMGKPSEDPPRGAAATDAAIAFLTLEADRLLERDRLHAGAQAARVLLEVDAHPPAQRDEVFQRIVELKTVAAGGGPLAPNAELRLIGFCRTAFADAARAPRRQRARVLSYCLYPLYQSDPAPYFADDPRRAPPPPDWTVLRDDMNARIDALAATESRLAVTAAAVREEFAAFIAEQESQFPVRPTPAALGVPTVEVAEPFEWTPLLAIGDGQAIASREDLISRFRGALAADDRGAVAVGLYGQSRADSLYAVAGALVEAGGLQLQLAVGYAQTLKAPPGDYWFGRGDGGGAVMRVGVIPLSLAPMSTTATAAAADDDDPRALGWDPRRATLGLHLEIDDGNWRLVGTTGVLTTIETATGDPRTALRDELARVQSAYPDEDGLVLAVSGGATYAALISAATAARRDAAGQPLFARLALATGVPAPKKNTLQRTVDRRARATVAIVPESLAPRIAVVRRCYQDIVEKSPHASGEIRLELGNDGAAAVASGPRGKPLRACVLDGVGPAMQAQTIASATITLSMD